MLCIMIYFYIAPDKIFFITVININELLWISVCKWKPTALYLHHYAMTFFKIVGNRR